MSSLFSSFHKRLLTSNAVVSHQMKPVLSVIADIDIAPLRIKDGAARFGISPRLLPENVFRVNPHILRFLLLITLYSFMARYLLGTSISLRRENDHMMAVGADSQRTAREVDSGGSILGEKKISVCKICMLERGIFVAAGGFTELDFCAIAQSVSRQTPTISEKVERFSGIVMPQIIAILNTMNGEILARTIRFDLVQFAFVGTESGIVKYSLFSFAAHATPVGIRISRFIRICPGQCRPYENMGSRAANAFIADTDRISLMKLPAVDFVRRVVGETIKRDSSAGGAISVALVDALGAHMVDAGECK